MQSVISLILRGDDQGASGVLGDVAGKVGGLGGVLQSAAGFAVGDLLVSGIGTVTGAMGGLFSEMVGGNAAFEQYETQFAVMLGSTEAAKERIADLAAFGASTPFELPGVVEADRILQGFGLHSEESAAQFGFSGEQIRTIAGDVASGTGSSFQEMAGLIGRFSAGATGEAISRMQELGITNRNELSNMGLEFSNSGQLLSPLPEAMSTVLQLMQEKYGGMMQAQSGTFSGMMSNLSDWKSATLRTLGEPIFEVLKDKLGDTLSFLSSPAVTTAVSGFATTLASGIGVAVDWFNTTGLPALQTFFGWLTGTGVPAIQQFVQPIISSALPVLQQLGSWFMSEGLPAIQQFAGNVLAQLIPGIQQLGSWVQQIAMAAWPLLGSAIQFVQDHFNLILPVIGVIGGVILALSSPITLIIGGVALLATAWANNWGGIQQKTQAALAFVQNIITTVGTAIQSFWSAHGESILAAAQSAWDGIKAAIDTALSVVKSVFAAFKSAFQGDWRGFGENLRAAWDTAWEAIKSVVSTAWEGIKSTVSNLISSVVDLFTGTDWGAVGRGIIDGIANAIRSGAAAIADAARAAAQAALDAAKGLLGIKSPSTVAAELIGKPFTQGIGVGILDAVRSVRGDIDNAVSALLPIAPAGRFPIATGDLGTGSRLAVSQRPVQINYQVSINDQAAMRMFLDFIHNQQQQLILEQF